MKVYGKQGNSVAIHYVQSEISDVELSDEGEIEIGEQAYVENMKLLAQRTNQSSESNVDTAAIAKGNSTNDNFHFTNNVDASFGNATVPSSFEISLPHEMSELEAFDFLDEHSQVNKRRKTNYKRHYNEISNDTEDVNPQNGINKTINELNEFLSSLKERNDNAIQETFKKELGKSVEEKSSKMDSKVTYGRLRTMLLSKDEDDAIELEEETEENHFEKPNIANLQDSVSTHHYNELKNMGEILKYQDDLEFLAEDDPAIMNTPLFTSKLLNLALTMNNDEEFCRYINRHCAVEVSAWCFSNKDFGNEMILLLQAYLSTKLNLPSKDLPRCFQQFMISLSSCSKLPTEHLIGSRMARMNYNDFLRKTHQTSGQSYSLDLYLKYPDFLSSREAVKEVSGLLDISSETAAFTERLLQVIALLVSRQRCLLEDIRQEMPLFNKLKSYLPEWGANEHLVKSLIMLTNEDKILSLTSIYDKNTLYKSSMDIILMHIDPIKADKIDVIILHLGLSLNIIGGCHDLELDVNQWKHARMCFSRLSANNRDDIAEDQNGFVFNMFYLNFAYMANQLKKPLLESESDFLIKALNSFNKDAKHYNGSIRDKISTALRKLL